MIVILLAGIVQANLAGYLSNTVTAAVIVQPSTHWVLWMQLDENSGTTTADSSTYGNNGALNGASWTTISGSNYAVSFDGVNDYIQVADSTSLRLSNALTIEGWIYLNSLAQPATLLAKWRDISSASLRSYILTVAADATPRFYLSTTGSDYPVAQGSPISIGQWHHLAATYNGSTMTLYVNAYPAATAPLSGTLFQNTEPILIGASDAWGGSNRKFTNGKIDDVKVFDIALTAQDIQTDYLRSCSQYNGCAP